MIDYQIKYQRLASLVKAYLRAQDDYFKNKKDRDKFKKMMAIRKELSEFNTPKTERTLFDLAQ